MAKKQPYPMFRRIIMGLRKAWMHDPIRQEVKRRVRHPDKAHLFKCEGPCAAYHEKITIDHIVPVVSPTEGFVDWNAFINALFVTADKLQALCYDCHKLKTQQENRLRKETKRANRQRRQHSHTDTGTRRSRGPAGHTQRHVGTGRRQTRRSNRLAQGDRHAVGNEGDGHETAATQGLAADS